MDSITLLASDWIDRLAAVIKSAEQDTWGNGDNLALVKSSWVALVADAPGDTKPHRSFKKFWNRLNRDYSGTVDALSNLADRLLRSVVHDGLGYQMESLHNAFSWTPVFREYKSWYENQDSRTLKYLLTFLWWGKKAEFVDPSLPEKAFRRWELIEHELRSLTPPDHVVEDMKFVLSHLPDPDMDYFHPKFGPGAVAEKNVHGVAEKLAVRYTSGLDDCLDMVRSNRPDVDLLIPDPETWALGCASKRQRSTDAGQYRTVPKDKNNVRSMVMEPNSNMYHQQGVMSMLLHAIDESPFGAIIDIRDQARNQKLALKSSADGLYSTLDLKDASDRAHNEKLVKRVFPALWCAHLQGSRSQFVVTPEGTRRVQKFAPMGSALCFPVQTLIFTSVIIIARWLTLEGITVEEYLANPHYMMSRIEVDPNSCVYGDDIIVPRDDALAVISLLEALGFMVNKQKCFHGDVMARESCGLYAMFGDEVTPIRFKVKGLAKAGSNDLEYVEGLIALCNMLFRAGYYSANHLLRRYLPRAFYVEVDETVLEPLPVHLLSFNPVRRRTRYDSELQRMICRVKVYKKAEVPLWTEEANRFAYARYLQGTNEPYDEEVKSSVRGGWLWRYLGLHKPMSRVSYRDAANIIGTIPPLSDVERVPTVDWMWVPV